MRLKIWYDAGLVAVVALVSGCGGETLEPLPSKFQVVVAGGVHSCGLLTDGAAYCWGNNELGQLGDGSTGSHVYPTPVVGSIRYTAISGGGGHTCAVATTGAAYCWGLNLSGQLGDGTQRDRSTPVSVTGGKSWIALSAGGTHSCGIATDGLAYCWGWNASGQLGDGTTTDRPAPAPVSGGLRFSAISANVRHTCALMASGAAYCWGSNEHGQLGTGDTLSSNTPVRVSGSLTWVALETGYSHSCGIAADGTGYCWGRNQYGQLGAGDSAGLATRTTPFPMSGGILWQSFDLGAYFSCGLGVGSAAWCWGYNGSGQLGGNAPDTCADETGITSTQCALSPFAVTGGLEFASVSAHTQHTCGLSVDGVAYCWGSGTSGQLGNGQKGDQIFSIEPVRVAGQPGT